MKLIPEIMEEVLNVLADHHGCTPAEVGQAYLAGAPGIVQSVQEVYTRAYVAIWKSSRSESSQ